MDATPKPNRNLPDIVIIHGGWHVPEQFAKLERALSSAGYTVHIPALPSVSETRPPVADLHTDAETVHSFVLDLLNKNISLVVLMHSYGGQVGSIALHGLGREARAKQGLEGGILKLIYVSAFLLPEGQSINGFNADFRPDGKRALTGETARRGITHPPMEWYDLQADGVLTAKRPKTLMFGDFEEDTEEIAEYLKMLKPWNAKTFMDAIPHAPAWTEIPSAYVFTSKDIIIHVGLQQAMVEDARAAALENGVDILTETITLETGHCPHVTATGELVEFIDELVKDLGY